MVDATGHPAAKMLTKKLFRFVVTSACQTQPGAPNLLADQKGRDLRVVCLPTARPLPHRPIWEFGTSRWQLEEQDTSSK